MKYRRIRDKNGIEYEFTGILAQIKYIPNKIGRNESCPECLKKGIRIKYKKCTEHCT